MNSLGYISGFSSWDKKKKIAWLSSLSGIPEQELEKYSWQEGEAAFIYDSLSENTVAHYSLPLGIAPNFKVNGKDYALPLVTEESSVVAAMAKAAKIWYPHGGFKAKVLGTVKKGQVHFFWGGGIKKLEAIFPELKEKLRSEVQQLTEKMEKRGGGILDIVLQDETDKIENYFQLDVDFDTGDAMGANFINSVLEKMAAVAEEFLLMQFPEFPAPEINMAILSNDTPGCLVEAWVECPVGSLKGMVKGISADAFANRFEKAVRISKVSRARAVTHNKGIFNGIDALALATGNDWRAIESAGHAYASNNGNYKGLTNVEIKDGQFRFSIKIPMNVGTVGGVTTLHPLARLTMKILQNPTANELMQLFAVAGLASNFSAVTALVGQGIQAGHMKLHLQNILIQLHASNSQKKAAKEFFKNKKITYSAIREFLKHSV